MLGSTVVILSMKSADLFTGIGRRPIASMDGNCGVRCCNRRRAPSSNRRSELLRNVPVKEAAFDALWFSRPSHNNREAWELRLLAQTQYALFETFEADETEEERDDVKLEMEARLREYLADG